MKKIGIASDHAGYELKNKVLDYLNASGYETEDFGSFSAEPSDYPDFAHVLASAVEDGLVQFGISLCGSGNGINMTANKHKGIRSALCWNEKVAELARLHNDANMCALPARFIDESTAMNILDKFLTTSFEGGRHVQRINKIPLK
jgi:ribose 5-phosphate isomerase B